MPSLGVLFYPEDKRLTHSVPGILFLWSFFEAFLLIPTFVLISSNALYLPVALPLRFNARNGPAPARGHVYPEGNNSSLSFQHCEGFRFDPAM